MTYVKMCGTWYKYPREKMSSREYEDFHAVVNIKKLENGQCEIFNAKATENEIFELGQQNLEELDEWECNSPEAAHEVKLKRLVQIVTEVLAHQDEAGDLCDELFGDDLVQATTEVSSKLPKLCFESEIGHLFRFFGMR